MQESRKQIYITDLFPHSFCVDTAEKESFIRFKEV